MKKKRKNPRKHLKPITLPWEYADASLDLDMKLTLLGELLFNITDPGFAPEVEVIREIGSEILNYLKSRNALELLVGRRALHDDDAFMDMARVYRRRFSGWNPVRKKRRRRK